MLNQVYNELDFKFSTTLNQPYRARVQYCKKKNLTKWRRRRRRRRRRKKKKNPMIKIKKYTKSKAMEVSISASERLGLVVSLCLIYGLGLILFLGLSPVSLYLIFGLGLILFLSLSLVFMLAPCSSTWNLNLWDSSCYSELESKSLEMLVS